MRLVQDDDNVCDIAFKTSKKPLELPPKLPSPKTRNTAPKATKGKVRVKVGRPSKISVREITAYMSKGTETDHHPGDDLHCA